MNNIDPVMYPFYAGLNDAQKQLYVEIIPHIEACDEIITPVTQIKSDDSMETVRAVYADHPEYFWLENTSSCTYSESTGIVSALRFKFNDLQFELEKHKKELDDAVNGYIRKVKNKPVLEQEIVVHNILARDIHYEFSKYDQNAYSALVLKNAVCNGYSRAIQLIYQRLNIPCYYCCGDVKSRKSTSWELHAWNIVKLGNEFVNLDLTWDDCYDKEPDTQKLRYKYFNVTDAAISNDHIRGDEFKFLPKCTSDKYTIDKILGINKEVVEMLSSGVSTYSVVRDQKSFMSTVCPLLRNTKERKFKISFPVYGDSVAMTSVGTWKKEAIQSVYGPSVSYNWDGLIYHYEEGWHMYEATVTIN